MPLLLPLTSSFTPINDSSSRPFGGSPIHIVTNQFFPMSDDLTRVSVILDSTCLDWLDSNTSRTNNRSRLIRELVYEQIKKDDKADAPR